MPASGAALSSATTSATEIALLLNVFLEPALGNGRDYMLVGQSERADELL
jgi:hypothetical protein